MRYLGYFLEEIARKIAAIYRIYSKIFIIIFGEKDEA